MADQDQLTPLQQAEAELADKEKSAVEAARIKARIADIRKTNSELEAKKKEYKKAFEETGRKKKEFDDYVETQVKMLAPVVDVKKIEAVHKKAKDELQKLEQDAQGAAVDKPKAATAEKQAAYTRLLTLHATILKDLAGLKAAAEKEYDANNLSRMYLLILFMNDRLNELTPTDPKEYEDALNAAAQALIAAADAERKDKDDRDAAAANEKALAKQLQDARGNWRQTALESVEEGAGTPAAAPEEPAPQQAHGGYGGSGGGSSPQTSTQS
jgi:hypothetical protein